MTKLSVTLVASLHGTCGRCSGENFCVFINAYVPNALKWKHQCCLIKSDFNSCTKNQFNVSPFLILSEDPPVKS